MSKLDQSRVRAGSWAGQLFEAAQEGAIHRLPKPSVRSGAYVVPSLDTTILAKGSLLHNIARDPAQWAMLRERPS